MGWLGGWFDGYVGRWLVNISMDGWTIRWFDESMDKWTGGCIIG